MNVMGYSCRFQTETRIEQIWRQYLIHIQQRKVEKGSHYFIRSVHAPCAVNLFHGCLKEKRYSKNRVENTGYLSLKNEYAKLTALRQQQKQATASQAAASWLHHLDWIGMGKGVDAAGCFDSLGETA